MTNREAIKWLEEMLHKYITSDPYYVALNMAIKALEKQIPTVPEKKTDNWLGGAYGLYCPSCDALVASGNSAKCYIDKINKVSAICHYCGQAIDWKEGER